jgi:hypothetical protein
MRIKSAFLFCFLLFSSLLGLAQLNGSYTIKPSLSNFSGDPNGISGKNYTSLNNAVSALKNYGISGQVTFNIDSGSYNEQISIPSITGTSATSRIVFQSANGDSSSVHIKFNNSNSNTNYVIQLNGGDYLTFRQLTVIASGKFFGRVIELTNNANYNIISNCKINAENGNSSYSAGIYAYSSSIGN